jgi:hypothetical protein
MVDGRHRHELDLSGDSPIGAGPTGTACGFDAAMSPACDKAGSEGGRARCIDRVMMDLDWIEQD